MAHPVASRLIERSQLLRRARQLAYFTVVWNVGEEIVFGWWWADPVAALGVVVFLFKETPEAFDGGD